MEDEVPEGGEGQQSISSDFVQSLERGLRVIRAFSADRPSGSIAELSAEVGLTRATVRRLLLTLEALGYAQSSGRRFSLTPRVLELGYAYLSSFGIGEVAMPLMEELTAGLGESCSMAVLDHQEIVYVARVPARRIMRVTLAVGSRLPAYCTSMGRVLLAALTEQQLEDYLGRAQLEKLTDRTVTDPKQLKKIVHQVREQGWALVDQELEAGVRSVAAPVQDRNGRTVVAMNISAHAGRISTETLHESFLPALLEVTDRVSRLVDRNGVLMG